MTLVKKANKTLAIAISAVAAATIMATAASAVQHEHQYGPPVDTIVYSSTLGTHSHKIGTYADGSPKLVPCTIVLEKHVNETYCSVCGSIGSSTTFNVERHYHSN